MFIKSTVISAPNASPISTDLAITHLRIESEEDVGYLTDQLIPVAVQAVEDYLNRSLITRTLAWTCTLHSSTRQTLFPALYGAQNSLYRPFNHPVLIPFGSVQSITSVFGGGYAQTDTALVAGTDYDVDLATDPSRLLLYPVARCWDHITITYVAGYGATDTSIPVPIKQAILLTLSHLYRNRGDVPADPMTGSIRNLLSRYRLHTVL